MGTIKTEIKTSGKGLMKNRECEVIIKPSRGGNIRIFQKVLMFHLTYALKIYIQPIIV